MINVSVVRVGNSSSVAEKNTERSVRVVMVLPSVDGSCVSSSFGYCCSYSHEYHANAMKIFEVYLLMEFSW
jgi:hypothetical protein